ncbi:uncharacterized protein [Manis javanica]|uniref:uncharacterized protein n=1 Tax=Manis javanica TaxID=9974 RepID=UPI003C6D73B8
MWVEDNPDFCAALPSQGESTTHLHFRPYVGRPRLPAAKPSSGHKVRQLCRGEKGPAANASPCQRGFGKKARRERSPSSLDQALQMGSRSAASGSQFLPFCRLPSGSPGCRPQALGRVGAPGGPSRPPGPGAEESGSPRARHGPAPGTSPSKGAPGSPLRPRPRTVARVPSLLLGLQTPPRSPQASHARRRCKQGPGPVGHVSQAQSDSGTCLVSTSDTVQLRTRDADQFLSSQPDPDPFLGRTPSHLSRLLDQVEGERCPDIHL